MVTPLWQRIESQHLPTVAVMGMSKNTGKTVCLNHLLAQAHGAGRALGITSIGRDGEERDEVFATPKPAVRVTPGCLVATARDTLVRSRTRTKVLGGTGVHSPMGEILIIKAMEAGDMEVAGPSLSHDQHRVIGLLRQCGAQQVLLDGALGRSHHASPAIADGVILATGAALGGGMADVLRKTRDRLAILGLAVAEPALAQRVQPVFTQGGVGVWGPDGRALFHEPIATLNAASALLQLHRQCDTAGSMATVAVSGAVGRLLWRALQTLLDHHPGLTLVVADGTRLFIDATELRAFERQGGRVLALRGIGLLGVTLNPVSPLGGGFDAGAFLAQARSTLAPYWVGDVCAEPLLQEYES
ncbi:MAG TPA: hypothetical protein VFM33_03895 [Aquabacterium sp.]|nr:hypothetical protein [Aquabacterium sp.]